MPNKNKSKFGRQTTALEVVEGIDLSGKTVLITGCNSGIGMETARAMALHNAHVVMACRNLKATEEVKANILKQYPNAKLDIIYFDSSKLKTVESCATEFIAKGWPLNILILNAGMYNPPEKMTEDGLESTFQVNYLAHFYLVQLLTPTLIQNAPVRIIHVSSEAHRFGKLEPNKITWKVLSPALKDIPSTVKTYGRSKFCNAVFSNELHRRLKDKGVTSNAVHPGVVRTQFTRNTGLGRLVMKLPFLGRAPIITMDKGAATSVYAATAPEYEKVGGLYFNACDVMEPDPMVNNVEAWTKLWELSEEMINKYKSTKPTTSSNQMNHF